MSGLEPGFSPLLQAKWQEKGSKKKKDKTDSGVSALLPPDEIGASEGELMKQSKRRFVN